MQIKAKAGQRQAIIIVGQSFLARAHVGQRWSWRAKGFELGPGNVVCSNPKNLARKSKKSGRKQKSGWRIQKNDSGGPWFQAIPGAQGSKRFRGPGAPEVPGGPPGLQKFPGAPGSGMIVSIILCARCLFSYARCFYSYARWFLA